MRVIRIQSVVEVGGRREYPESRQWSRQMAGKSSHSPSNGQSRWEVKVVRIQSGLVEVGGRRE